MKNNCVEYFFGGESLRTGSFCMLDFKRRTCLKVARLMRLKGSYFVLAPKVEPSLIGSWRIWKIGKFCVLKGAVNLWCSAQRDALKEECSGSIFHIWLLSPFTFSIVSPSNNVTSWKLSKEGFMSGRNATEGKHLVDVIFHFSKFSQSNL